jgi:hypothetical protein
MIRYTTYALATTLAIIEAYLAAEVSELGAMWRHNLKMVECFTYETTKISAYRS